MGLEGEDLYLGHALDVETGEPSGARLNLPSHQLTTHGVIVGMTGSGKTGLGVVLLEEVLGEGIPALILDPKGDMGNLLLNFPSLQPRDFEPWVDPGEASRRDIDNAQLASDTAASWRRGLAASGIPEEAMTRLTTEVEMRVITPGSTAGIPLNVIGSLDPPGLDWEAEGEAIRDEIEGLVSGILVLAEIEPDPLTSPEHILLSNLVEHAWQRGKSLDLPALIGQIQQPPFRKLGVFDLDTFYPAKERMKLAMRLNSLLASPAFTEWMLGEPLDMATLLRGPGGRPRASIVYLSHLSERERVFVVTLLLSKMVTWMRRQAGTSELRALVYADEVMGLAPPTAEPPSKRPILTLFKQARAHGVGMVVATQNPVDLDYKLMSNAGTWMVGRLQTERDKARILEAMRSASGEIDVNAWNARIGALGKRQFVLKSARSSKPVLFTTRWAMSFLRGPLTRSELIRLKEERGFRGPREARPGTTVRKGSPSPVSHGDEPAHLGGAASGASAASVRGPEARPSDSLAADESPIPPRIAPGISVRYLDPAAPWAEAVGVVPGGRRLEAGLAARVKLLFDERRGDLRHEEAWEAVFFPLAEPLEAETGRHVDHDPRDFRKDEPPGVVYALPTAPVDAGSFFQAAEREIEGYLFRSRTLTLLRNQALKLYSRVGEREEAFRNRCLEAAEEGSDAEAGKVRDRFEARLRTARKRAADTERRVRELEVDTRQRRQEELVSGAGEVLSLFLGGRRRSRSLSGISSRRSRTLRTQERLRSAEEKLEDYEEDILDLEEELRREIREIWGRWEERAKEIDSFEVGLERTDVQLEDLILFWAPVG
jgi:hypothetical protein